ncbi:MAG: hypothetical protein AAFX99_03205, partial [Myxococcota bacterium]
MKILIISYYFPPYNAIGAVRVGHTARLLADLGHEVKVISARDQVLAADLPLQAPSVEVIRTPWLNVNQPIVWALGGREKVTSEGFQVSQRSTLGKVMRALGSLYYQVVNFPDGLIGWFPYALQASFRVVERWKPSEVTFSRPPRAQTIGWLTFNQ